MTSYLIADEGSSLWGHIFPDEKNERLTRFVFDLGMHVLLAVQIQTGPTAGWRDATPAELLDVADDIETNRPFDAPGDWSLEVASELPDWSVEIATAAQAQARAICEQAAQDDNLVPDEPMDFDAWIEWSGLDASFVGDLQRGIPGTRDKFDAAERLSAAPSSPRP